MRESFTDGRCIDLHFIVKAHVKLVNLIDGGLLNRLIQSFLGLILLHPLVLSRIFTLLSIIYGHQSVFPSVLLLRLELFECHYSVLKCSLYIYQVVRVLFVTSASMRGHVVRNLTVDVVKGTNMLQNVLIFLDRHHAVLLVLHKGRAYNIVDLVLG